MPNLKCYKYSCKNNTCNHCKLDNILVSKEALCSSFEKEMYKDERQNFEFAYDKCMSMKQDECHITCEDYACINNTSGECKANYIRIDECKEYAKCCQVREI